MSYQYGTEEWDQAYNKMIKERLDSAPKPYIMATPEWTATFEKLIQNDEKYKEVAKTWEGSVVISILPKPEAGLEKALNMYMDLWHGQCNYVKLVPPEVAENADYVLSGELERWEAVMKKELDVVKAMMQGKIKLKGSLPMIVRYVKASLRLVELAAEIDTVFHNDLAEQERTAYLDWFNKLRSEFGF